MQTTAQDLIERAAKYDPGLAADIRAFAKAREFGLVFEHNRPEAMRLYGKKISKGDTVHILAPRGKAEKSENKVPWRVTKITGETAHLERTEGAGASCKVDLCDLVAVAAFEEPIYAGLREVGRVERGVIKKMEPVEIVGLSDEKKNTVVTDIEMFHKLLDFAEAGDNIGALLRGIDKKSIERGQVLAKPGSIHPHTKFKGQVYVLTKEEGGRHTPFFNNYRPQFYFRTTDVTGIISLPEGVEMCMPGDNVDMDVELITPIAIENGLRFAIREGGRTVGSGVVIAINED